ncbi:MAG: hypothetical protein HN341_08395 [Verrucomicrobia bacterium]|jgi:hypothetical protein|nr:hypothetical protein [Verrucomicrobiota bacterium]
MANSNTPTRDNFAPSRPISNARWEGFAQDVFGGATESDAYRSHYPHSSRWKAQSVHREASRLATKVRPRIEWLQSQVASSKILTVQEADEILSETIRAVVPDYQVLLPDGNKAFAIDEDSPNPHAVKKATVRIDSSGEGSNDSQFVSVELHDKKGMLDLFYKRKGAYAPAKHALTDPQGNPAPYAFAPMPMTIADWEQQCAEADAQKKGDA